GHSSLMADIPPTSAVSQTAPVAPTSGNNIIVEAAVNNKPDKIFQLTRQIEVSGTIEQPPLGNAVTMKTGIGPLMLILPQVTLAQQEKMQQQLMALFQNQKPLTVVLQPGNPPAQAFLLLPPNTGSAANSAAVAQLLNPQASNLPILQPNVL